MVRNVLGSILALIGATAAVWSPFRAWYDGRHGSAYRIDDLFSGISADKAQVAGSMLLPLAFAALLTLIGLVLRSRLLVAVAGLVVLGFTILWMVRQGQEAGHLTVDSSGKGLGQGVAMALGGGLVLLLASALMAGRRRNRLAEPTGYGAPTAAAAHDPHPTPAHPASPDETAPRGTAPYPTAPQDPASHDTTPHGTAPDETAPYRTPPYPYADEGAGRRGEAGGAPGPADGRWTGADGRGTDGDGRGTDDDRRGTDGDRRGTGDDDPHEPPPHHGIGRTPPYHGPPAPPRRDDPPPG
ncbi:hypothetical protein [Streptomyces sp. NPDC048111]|uniref:hypothetical protein n=1 Tax=Streptomyces sp. NPDC048111 TaxID=3365500 RepID=UPI0037179698